MFELNLTNTYPLLVGIFMVNHFNYKFSDVLPVKFIPVKMNKFNRQEFLSSSRQIVREYLKERENKNYIKYI